MEMNMGVFELQPVTLFTNWCATARLHWYEHVWNYDAVLTPWSTLVWNPKIHYSVPILRQIHAVHTVSSYFPKIHSNIIFPYMPRSAECLPFRISDEKFVSLMSYVRATFPARLIIVDITQYLNVEECLLIRNIHFSNKKLSHNLLSPW